MGWPHRMKYSENVVHGRLKALERDTGHNQEKSQYTQHTLDHNHNYGPIENMMDKSVMKRKKKTFRKVLYLQKEPR
jgi:hypothetical protein